MVTLVKFDTLSGTYFILGQFPVIAAHSDNYFNNHILYGRTNSLHPISSANKYVSCNVPLCDIS